MRLQRKLKAEARWFNPEARVRRACAQLRARHSGFNILSSFVILVSSLSAADAADLRNIVTEEPVTMDEVERTKAYGALVKSVREGPAKKAGIEPGDIVCAVDEWRVFDDPTYSLARYQAPMDAEMRLLINRGGNLKWVTVSDLEPGRRIHVDFDRFYKQDRLEVLARSAGVKVDEAMSAASRTAPRRLAVELELHPPKKGDSAWLRDHLRLLADVWARNYAAAVPVAQPAPLPIFERVSKFYAAVAARNKDKELPPDPKACGESAGFFALYRPIPELEPPPLGKLALSDEKLQKLLERRRAAYYAESAELSEAAREYARFGPDKTASFVGQTCAAMLDPTNHGGWPYRSALIHERQARREVVRELLSKLENKADPDWPVLAHAAVAPLCIEGRSDEAADLIRRLGEQSPFLGWQAIDIAFQTGRHWKRFPKRMQPVLKVAAETGCFLPADQPELFRWALREVNAVLLWSQERGVSAVPDLLLRDATYSVVEALRAKETTKDE